MSKFSEWNSGVEQCSGTVEWNRKRIAFLSTHFDESVLINGASLQSVMLRL